MKTEEFRIGNLLCSERDDAILIVAGLSTSEITTVVADRTKFPLPDGWVAKPIRLTSYYMDRAGFNREHAGDPVLLWKFESIVIQEINGEFSLCLNEKIISVPILFVHELQNICYAINGIDIDLGYSLESIYDEKKIEQNHYPNLEVDVIEPDIVQIWMQSPKDAQVVQVERENLLKLINILTKEYVKLKKST